MHLISQRECAARLNCTTRTIRNMIADGRLEAVDGRVVETSLDRLLTAGDDAASEDLGRESPGEPRPVHPWVAKVENAKADFETLKIGAASRDFMAARAEQHAPSGPTLEDLHRERLGSLRGSVFEELAKGQPPAVQARLWDAVVAYVTNERFEMHAIDHIADDDLIPLIRERVRADVIEPLERRAAEQAAEQVAEQRREIEKRSREAGEQLGSILTTFVSLHRQAAEQQRRWVEEEPLRIAEAAEGLVDLIRVLRKGRR